MAAPSDLSPPAGFGVGQGGSPDLPGLSFAAGPTPGLVGGYGSQGMPLGGTFYGRSGATKEKALIDGGGTKETEAAVARGLKWIARQQITRGRRAGCFPLDGGRYKDQGQKNDIAGTAFGLLPLLGAGYTHRRAKNVEANPYKDVVAAGLAFLAREQDKKTGNFGGGMYAHALATIAICEAYGLSGTGSHSKDPWLRRHAQMAVKYLVDSQHSAGGWRYGPKEPGDTSVTGWVVMALKSAQMAGLEVHDPTMRKAVRFLEKVCNPADEGYGYTGPGSTYVMSSVGLLCRQYLQNWGSQNLRLVTGVEKNLLTRPPGSVNSIYYYYYASQVMHHFGGKEWVRWNEKMRDLLVKTQEKEAKSGSDTAGSWNSAGDAHGSAGGRLMVTSLSLLTLEIYYRHLPLYYRDSGDRRGLATKTAIDTGGE
jgi:hypothetical protein